MIETLKTQSPEQNERHISDGLDTYKLYMGQVALNNYPDATVTFTLNNRAESKQLSEFVEQEDIENRIKEIKDKGFSNEEIEYFRSIRNSTGGQRFSEEYLSFLEDIELPAVNIKTNPETGEFDISTTGLWPSVSLWETVIMSELNELYFQGKVTKEGLDIEKIYEVGDRRLTEKIEILKNRPDIKFTDFGTRRRFSAQWQEYIIGRLANELPDNLVGTSNPWFAHKFGIKPVGTYAHEMPMVIAGLNDLKDGRPLDGHSEMIKAWRDYYQDDLSIALTDTFTTDFFFKDFGEDGAKNWQGLRHDSGDPYEFGDKAIEFYEQHDVDPTTKTLVFSDGLDIEQIIKLADYFKGKVNLMFGWGTTLTNDLGLPANNFVMKATNVNGMDTVKLSDAVGKHTGPAEKVHQYQEEISKIFEGSLV